MINHEKEGKDKIKECKREKRDSIKEVMKERKEREDSMNTHT